MGGDHADSNHPAPQSSRSVSGAPKRGFLIGLGSAEGYIVYEKTVPNWSHVLCAYGYTALLIAWMIAVACCYDYFFWNMEIALSVILIFISFTSPALMPVALSVYARRKLRE